MHLSGKIRSNRERGYSVLVHLCNMIHVKVPFILSLFPTITNSPIPFKIAPMHRGIYCTIVEHSSTVIKWILAAKSAFHLWPFLQRCCKRCRRSTTRYRQLSLMAAGASVDEQNGEGKGWNGEEMGWGGLRLGRGA